MSAADRGAVLLEAVVALAVLGTLAGGAGWLAAESIGAVRRAHEAEARVRAANRLLTAVSLWPREDLDRHLGATAQGPWRMRIDRSDPLLYAVSLVDTMSGQVVLRTALFREDVAR